MYPVGISGLSSTWIQPLNGKRINLHGTLYRCQAYFAHRDGKTHEGKAKQQEEKILASLGKLSRSEIDALIAQWRLNLE